MREPLLRLGIVCLGVAWLGYSIAVKGDGVRGHLDMLVLATLLTQPLHGYAVIERLRQRSDGQFDLPEGTIYPVLHRLEAAGLLESIWSTDTGRRRRQYTITTAGLAAYQDEKSQWQRFSAAVAATLKNARGQQRLDS